MLSKQLKKELSEILRKDFGMNLSEKEAFEVEQDLINLFELLIESGYEENHKKD